MTYSEAIVPPTVAFWITVAVGLGACWAGGQRDRAVYRRALPGALVVLACIQGLVFAVCGLRHLFNPWWSEPSVWQFLGLFLAMDVLAWLGHAALHHFPGLWQFHAHHHDQREPYGIHQFDIHPVDHLLTFWAPGLVAFTLVPLTLPLATLCFVISVLANILAHGPFGWEHRRHHLGERVSLGGGVWFDWAMGTSDDALRIKAREWALLTLTYFAFVWWPVTVAAAALYGAFKLTLYFVTDIAAARTFVWRSFYSAFDWLLGRTGNDGFDTMNWGYSATDDPAEPFDHPRELHLALYEHIVGDAPVEAAILEVGSGRAGGALHLIDKGFSAYTGLDLSPAHVARGNRELAGRSAPGAAFVEGNAEALPFPAETFDVLLNVESSHCYPHFETFLAEYNRVLLPGGELRWCDFREMPAWRDLRAALQADPSWEIITSEDLTPAILNASRRLTPWYRERMRFLRWCVPLYETLENFGNLVGTRNYRMFESGAWTYRRLVLRKAGAEDEARRPPEATESTAA